MPEEPEKKEKDLGQPPSFIFEEPKKEEKSSIEDGSTTGIEGLDELLSGGIPVGSVVLLAGSSGSGKTIFSFQWLFNGVKNNENGVYFTVTEPLFRSIKNLELMGFYDREAVENEKLRIIDMRNLYDEKGFDQKKVLKFIEDNVRKTNAKRLCIDSITAIAYSLNDKSQIRSFIFELGKILATLGCTTILTSEVVEKDRVSVYEVEEFISDAIIRLDQVKVRDELHRVMKVIKCRGRAFKTEDLYFKISENGLRVFPKFRVPLRYPSTTERVSSGLSMLDEMLLGGFFKGSTTLIAGSTGTGKSLLSAQFIMQGLKSGEKCLYAGFEESREQLVRNAMTFGWNLDHFERSGQLVLRCFYPSEKYLEEHLADIRKIVEEKKIQRCVVDSLSAISNSFEKDSFISFVRRLNGYLKNQNVTTFFTSATETLIGAQTLTDAHLSTITDNIIMLRYVEMEGELKLVMNIIKVRGSSHSKWLRRYEITGEGLTVGQSLSGYEGIMTGVTRKVSDSIEEKLLAEFNYYIGPMAASVFSKLKKQGLKQENIMAYIDELQKDKILKKDDAEKFKKDVEDLLSSESAENA